MGFASCILAFFFQEESYGPVILVSKASELRRLTRNWGIHAKQEEVEVDLKELITKNVSRPIRILFTEPIVLLVTTYMSFIYGLLYLSLTAYALIFGGVYHFSPGVAGLPYVGMIVGVFIGFAIVCFLNAGYVKKLKANDNIPVPEWRMPIVMFGGVSFSIGLFWLGWTGYKESIPWIVPTLSGLCLGFGIYTVFLSCLNYIIDGEEPLLIAICHTQLTLSQPTSCSPPRPLQPTPSCAVCLALCSRSSLLTCLRVWASTMLLRFSAR